MIYAAFMVDEGLARGLGLRDRIISVLAFMIHDLPMMVISHYLWLSFDCPLYARVVSETIPDIFGDIAGAENVLVS